MVPQIGIPDSSLMRALFEEGYRFEFFQAVRLLERSGESVGGTASPAEEAVRFAAHLSLAFPPSEIHEITEGVKNPESGRQISPPDMTVAFMGLTGQLGVLPRHYTEFLLQRVEQKDYAAREFFDLFTHRFVSLFYRAWAKYRCVIGFERAVHQDDHSDPFTEALYALAGLRPEGLRCRELLKKRPFPFYAGLLAQQPHSAASLEGILRDYLGVPVTIEQFVGRWMALSHEDWTRLGDKSLNNNNQIGTSAMLGQSVWETQSKFRVLIGPLPYQQYCQFLPQESALELVRNMTRFVASPELEFDIQLSLSASEVPLCRLGAEGEERTQLGRSTWLGSLTRNQHADDFVLAG